VAAAAGMAAAAVEADTAAGKPHSPKNEKLYTLGRAFVRGCVDLVTASFPGSAWERTAREVLPRITDNDGRQPLASAARGNHLVHARI
jgi:hypothetical protein